MQKAKGSPGRCRASGAMTRGGRKHYTTATGQKPDWAEGLCCFALFGAIPAVMAIVGGAL